MQGGDELNAIAAGGNYGWPLVSYSRHYDGPRIVFNENGEELRRESLLGELRQRIRDVRQGPDGLIYLRTEENRAALLRLEPVAEPPG